VGVKTGVMTIVLQRKPFALELFFCWANSSHLAQKHVA